MNQKICLLFAVVLLSVNSNVIGQSLTVTRLNSQLDQPVFATFAPGSPNRLYIVEKEGTIRVLNLTTGNLNNVDFMVVPNVFSNGDEPGLTGLAFHPDFANNGYFYVNFNDTTGADTQIVRYTATNFNRGEPSSALKIMEIDQPQSTHNGGWIGFGDDGYLYISVGDGGGSDDDDSGHTAGIGNAQDITNNLLGTILRIDVDSDDFPGNSQKNYSIPADNPFVGILGDDEIFVYGMRNPWRCSFDRATGDLYIADVGQDRREEITVIPANSSGGENLGWRLREGVNETQGSVGGPRPADAIDPIYDYAHGNGDFRGFSVTGGYVYRGPIAELKGHYFFGDFVTDNLWSLQYDGSSTSAFNGTNFTNLVQWDDIVSTNGGSPDNFSAFAEDSAGRMYVLDFNDGEIFRIEDGSFGSTPGNPGTFGGNVAVSVSSSGDLRVTGENDTSQCIIVEARATPGRYAFSSVQENGSGGTTFNGQTTLVVNGVTDDMRFDVKSGRKVLILSEGNAAAFNVPDNLKITSTGDSPAVIILDSLSVGGRTDVTTRNGDDAILLHNNSLSERLRVSSGSGNDVVIDGPFGLAGVYDDDLDIRTGSGNDDAICLGTRVLDRCSFRMGSGADGTAVRDSIITQARIFGNGDFDRYGAQNNVMGTLLLRHFENENANVQSILNQARSRPAYQDAEMFFTILGLDD